MPATTLYSHIAVLIGLGKWYVFLHSPLIDWPSTRTRSFKPSFAPQSRCHTTRICMKIRFNLLSIGAHHQSWKHGVYRDRLNTVWRQTASFLGLTMSRGRGNSALLSGVISVVFKRKTVFKFPPQSGSEF